MPRILFLIRDFCFLMLTLFGTRFGIFVVSAVEDGDARIPRLPPEQNSDLP
jgi:hypothetical protein